MHFRIVGPLEVVGDRPVVVTAGRLQIVLATMLLEANSVLPVDRLVDAVWEESPPSTARSQIQICISALRRELGEAGLTDRIRTRPPGYQLIVGDDELDLHVFGQLVAEGRNARGTGDLQEAATTFRRALALWRGEPLAGLDSRVIRAAAARISERHIAVVEECIDAELELGRHRDLVSELTGLVAEYPLRERLRAQLMLALYRDGRRADALDAYRSARQTLIEDLGLEPGESLRKLEHAILTDDPSLIATAGTSGGDTPRAAPVAPPPTPHMLPADILDFTGHDHLIEQARAQLCGPDRPADTTTAPIVVITGRGGVGKTASAVHLAHQMLDAFPDGQLYAQLGGGGAQAADLSQTLERFLRALGAAGTTIPDSQEERATLYRSLISGRRTLVVLDDAADERQVDALLPGSPTCGVLVTSRARLTGIPGAQGLDIDVLSGPSALELLARVVDRARVSAEPGQALELVELCGRLPLAIRIAGARLAARSHWTIGQLTARLADDTRRLDELTHGSLGVRASIELTYEYLDDEAKRLFWRLGILEADDFAGWVAAPLLDMDTFLAADVLETLVDARLVDVVGGTGNGTRYRLHDLVRVYAREKLASAESSTERMGTIRRLLGAWLFLADNAHRRAYGGDHTVIHSDAARWELAPPVVEGLLADPLDWYDSERTALVAAVAQAARSGAVDECWDLAITLVTLFEARNYLDDWRSTHEAALRAAQQGRDRRGEAAMLYSLGSLCLVQQRFDEAEVRLLLSLEVFDEIGDAHGRALALRNVAFLDRTRGKLDIAIDRYRQALTALQQIGDDAGVAHVRNSIAQILLDTGDIVEARTTLDEALQVAIATKSVRIQAQVLHRLGEVHLVGEQLDEAERAFSRSLALVRQGRDSLGESYALSGLGAAQTRMRRYDEALSTLTQAHALAVQNADLLAIARSCLALADLHDTRGERDRASTWARQALEKFESVKATTGRRQALALLRRLDSKECQARQPPKVLPTEVGDGTRA